MDEQISIMFDALQEAFRTAGLHFKLLEYDISCIRVRLDNLERRIDLDEKKEK